MSPNPIALVSLLKGKIRTQRGVHRGTSMWRHSGRNPHEHESRDQSEAFTSQEMPKIVSQPPWASTKAWDRIRLAVLRTSLPRWLRDFRLLASRSGGPGLWSFVWQRRLVESHRAGHDWAMSTHTHGGGPRKLVCTTIRVFSLAPWFLLHDFAVYLILSMVTV